MDGVRFFVGLVIVSAIVFAGFGAWIARQNGRRPAEGFMLGFCFGPFGVLVEALMPDFGFPTGRRRSRPLTDDELAERFPAIAERMGRRSSR